MSAKKILVEDRPSKPGDCLVTAVVGPLPNMMDLFEIRLVGRGRRARANYYVNHEIVTPQVYRDALATADKDRYFLLVEDDEPPEAAEQVGFS